MSTALLTAIQNRAQSDALNEFKKQNTQHVSRYSLSDVSVVSSFVGYIYSANLTVTTDIILFKNTTIHRIELIYGQDGEFRQLKSLLTKSEFNPSF